MSGGIDSSAAKGAYAKGRSPSWRLNGILKEALGHPRPQACDLDGYGMPSNHAQFMGFLVSLLTCRFSLFLKPMGI